MCGFVGFTGILENRKEILNKMMDRILHRGRTWRAIFSMRTSRSGSGV